MEKVKVVPDTRPQGARLLRYGVPLLTIIAFFLAACSSSPLPFRGTALSAKPEATPFTLEDQFGHSVSLSDFRGKVVLLTFLYTSCPDVCPITTSQLRDAHEMLGDDAKDVALVAVSVDPERDDVQAAHQFSERWKMTDRWSYLVGAEEQLEPVWNAYYIDPAVSDRDEGAEHTADTSLPAQRGGGVNALIQQSYLVIHSAPIYLIDQGGAMRAVFTLPFDTEDLVHDVRLLLD